MEEKETNRKVIGIDGKESVFGKAFLECSQELRIAEFEAHLNGLEQPDPMQIIAGYFDDKNFLIKEIEC